MKNANRFWILILSVCLFFSALTLPVLVFLLISPNLLLGGLILGVLLAALLLFLMVFFWWAPNNLFFTFVPEGRAKVVVKGDAFQRILIQWKGFSIRKDLEGGLGQIRDVGDIVEGDAPQKGWFNSFFGGLKFYGFWPIEDIYLYDFTWTGIDPGGSPRKHEKETLDYILLKEDVYYAEVLKAEDKDLLPLDVKLILSIRVVNPYKALFRIQNWLEAVQGRIAPAVRNRITEKPYSEWIEPKRKDSATKTEGKDLADEIYRDLEEAGILRTFEEDYGVKVNATEVREIDPGEELRNASLQEYLASREAARIETVYGAIAEQGEIGKMIRIAESMEKSGGTYLLPLPPQIMKLFQGEQGESHDS